jgi:hypothetical protein
MAPGDLFVPKASRNFAESAPILDESPGMSLNDQAIVTA